MARQAKPVSGVYEKVDGSGVWYIRYRTQGKLVRKKIGTQKQAKDYLDKLKLVRATGDGIVPVTATEPVRTVKEAADLAVVEGTEELSNTRMSMMVEAMEDLDVGHPVQVGVRAFLRLRCQAAGRLVSRDRGCQPSVSGPHALATVQDVGSILLPRDYFPAPVWLFSVALASVGALSIWSAAEWPPARGKPLHARQSDLATSTRKRIRPSFEPPMC